jgi:hypothetical protein
MLTYEYLRRLMADIRDAMLEIKATHNVTIRQLELRDKVGQRRGPTRQTIWNVMNRTYKTKGLQAKVLAELKNVAAEFRSQKLREALDKFEAEKGSVLSEQKDTTLAKKEESMI